MPNLKFFPTVVHRAEMPQATARTLNARLLRESGIFREMDDAGRAWSAENYPAGYTSYSTIADLPFRSSNVAQLKRWIDRQVMQYARTLELDLEGGRLEMRTCWLNIMGKNSTHSFHLHPLSTISGTYYVDVPKGSGSLKLEDPRLPAFMGSPPRKRTASLDNQRFVRLIPKAGTLILFESWLKHEVPANRSDRERISISFNYDWIRS